MVYILCFYICYIALFCGIGLITLWAFKLCSMTTPRFSALFWLGWSATILILQIWHFFAPITKLLFFPLISLSLIGWMISYKSIVEDIKSVSLQKIIVFLLIFISTGVWIASLATESSVPYDTGLYHIQVIKWNSEYAIVPGLGNLHSRLAFNNSNFLYASLLDNGFWEGKSFHISNSLLMFVLVFQLLYQIYKKIIVKPFPVSIIFDILLLSAAISWSYGYPVKYGLTSYNQDLVIFVISSIVLNVLLNALLSRKSGTENKRNYLFIAVVAVCGITVKLSFLPLAILSIVAISVSYFRQRIISLVDMFRCNILPVLLIFFWIVRNLILSGYFLYPSPVISLPVKWRIPVSQVERTQRGIVSWARYGTNADGSDLDNAWQAQWYARTDIGIKWAFYLGIGFSGCALILSKFNKKKLNISLAIWLGIVILSIIVWFFTAPHVRFSAGLFSACMAGGCMLLADQLSVLKQKIYRSGVFLIVITFAVANAYFLRTQSVSPVFRIELGPDLKRMQADPTKYTDYLVDGVAIYYPVTGDQCWNTPLPCSPQPNSRLHLISSPDIQCGFWMEEKNIDNTDVLITQ